MLIVLSSVKDDLQELCLLSCLRTKSIYGLSSKCLKFAIFIYIYINKIDIKNCCVHNSVVAINVPVLIKMSLSGYFLLLILFIYLCKKKVLI